MHLSINPRRATARRLGSAGLAGLLLATLAGQALAHEERDVAGYGLEVGLIAEPVFVGDRSGLEFHVTKDDKPVSGLDKTLTAQVVYNEQTRDLPLVEREEDPGWYESVFIPTAAGKYTFHLVGTIEGAAVDESFTSSPTGFNEVQEASSGQFPVSLPTTTELSAGIQKAADAANQARIAMALGGIALVVGVLGLAVAVAGRRRPAA